MIGLAALLLRADELEVNKFEPKLKYSHIKNIQVIVWYNYQEELIVSITTQFCRPKCWSKFSGIPKINLKIELVEDGRAKLRVKWHGIKLTGKSND